VSGEGWKEILREEGGELTLSGEGVDDLLLDTLFAL